MIACIAVRGAEVAGFLDEDAELELRRIEGSRAVLAGCLKNLPADADQRLAALAERKVEMLVCGSVGQDVASRLAREGIRVLPFQTGDAHAVLQAVLRGGPAATSGMPSSGPYPPTQGRGPRRSCGPCAVRRRRIKSR